jgi:Kef-type K+ transport system membrane component KefB
VSRVAFESDPIIQAIVAVSIFLLGAKLLSELFLRLRLPTVLGELGAGIVLGPLFFGGFVQIQPSPIQVNQIVLAFAQIGGIVILFIAGLSMPFREFVRGGIASFTTGTVGVLLPFFGGLLLFAALGFSIAASLMVAAALTATSIAISIQTLREVGRLNTPEGRLVIGAAVVDDVLAIAVLSVVVSIIGGGPASLSFLGIASTIGSVLLLFGILLAISVVVQPRLARSRVWRTPGSLETIVTAFLFGMAAFAAAIGLSPIVGAFAAGMGLAGANVAQRMREYIEKLEIIFRPLFFAVIGAQVNLTGISPEVALVSIGLIVIAIVSKLAGCGLPASFFLKSRSGGYTVGIAMISRGEVGLIIAGLATASGVISAAIYSVIVLMVVATTVVSPIWLKRIVSRPVSTTHLPSQQQPPDAPAAPPNYDEKIPRIIKDRL